MNVSTLGIDLAKAVFQLHGVNEPGQVTLTKRLSRKQLLPFLANLPLCLIGLEACSGAHYWAREMQKLGHEVKLIAPQFVRPYVKGNKTDGNDAAAICEAVSRPHMHFVTINTPEQQDIQAMHRIREQVVKNRTALANQIRGLLHEYGVVMPSGISRLRAQLPLILEDAENGLSDLCRELIHELYQRLRTLDEQVGQYDQRIQQVFKQDERCQRLGQVEGIGPLIATAFLAAVGDASVFHNGRQVAAWLGLVPKQHASGGKARLLGISKRGDRYWRTLLIHGARAAVCSATHKHDARSAWLNRLRERRGKNVAAVALANKNARILWALLVKGEAYRQAS
jgi:transposase